MVAEYCFLFPQRFSFSCFKVRFCLPLREDTPVLFLPFSQLLLNSSRLHQHHHLSLLPPPSTTGTEVVDHKDKIRSENPRPFRLEPRSILLCNARLPHRQDPAPCSSSPGVVTRTTPFSPQFSASSPAQAPAPPLGSTSTLTSTSCSPPPRHPQP